MYLILLIMAIEVSILWKCASGAYSLASFRAEVDNIYQQIKAIYSDISHAHVNSAKQALLAAESSNYRVHEILDAISHTRDAYNVSNVALDKTREVRSLFFFTSNEAVIPYNERDSYHNLLAHLAGIISILYRSINESKSSEDWKKTAIGNFRLGFNISREELKSINPNFVDIEYEEDNNNYGAATGDGALCRGNYEYEIITEDGYKCIENQRNLKAEDFEKSIDNRTLSL